jgi:FkbM family methyltransferase
LRGDSETFEVEISSSRGPIQFLFTNRDNLDFIASLVSANGLAKYEEPTPAIFVGLVQAVTGSVLDVGANTGLFALLAAAANPVVRVFAFEPLAAVREALHANIVCNPRLAARIAVEPIGLSRTDGDVPFFETINDQGFITTSSSLEFDHARRVGGRFFEHTITTRTLDHWANTMENCSIGMIKIDVEGHEHAVIEGGRCTISRHRPFIIVEVLGPSEVIPINDLLTNERYLDFALAPGVLRYCQKVRFHSDGWNHLLCPAENASEILFLCKQLALRIEID